MFRLYVVVNILAAAANLYAASNDFRCVPWVLENMAKLGIPSSRLYLLGVLKCLGGLGLIVGFAVPSIGIAAATGLVLFFIAAIIATIRARWYAHIPIPSIWLFLAAGSLLLRMAV